MMERQAELINLWKQCFEDTDEFIQLFFERVYKAENVLTLEREGQIVSALYLLPYRMNYYSKEIAVDYIYAVGTLPSWRNQGLMRELFSQAYKVMQQRKTALAVLIPAEKWLFDYYGKLGFLPAFDYETNLFSVSGTTIQTDPNPVSFSEEEIYTYFDYKIRERNCCILHTANDFHTLLEDLRLSGGAIITLSHPNYPEIQGMAMLYPRSNQWLVKEMFYENQKIKGLLLNKCLDYAKTKELLYLTPVENPEKARPLGMARIIDAEKMMDHWLSTPTGKAYSVNQLRQMDSDTLTRLLLGTSQHEAYMSLMLD